MKWLVKKTPEKSGNPGRSCEEQPCGRLIRFRSVRSVSHMHQRNCVTCEFSSDYAEPRPIRSEMFQVPKQKRLPREGALGSRGVLSYSKAELEQEAVLSHLRSTRLSCHSKQTSQAALAFRLMIQARREEGLWFGGRNWSWSSCRWRWVLGWSNNRSC